MPKKRDTQRRTEYMSISALKANPRNPKGHRVDVIDDSVNRFGYVEPIVLDERTQMIISGHGRRETLNAMRERGESAPDGVIVNDDGDWLVPVMRGWASRSDAEAGAALIALNRTTEIGGWVDDSLLELLDALGDDDDALLGVGFDDSDLDALRARLDEFSDDSDGEGGKNLKLHSVLQIVIDCDSEQQQAELLTRFESEGLTCRPLMM
jgi:hypothetical protein